MERRIEPRVSLGTPNRIRIRAEGRDFDAKLFDISNVGAFVATDADLPEHTHVEIELTATDSECVWLKAIVARRADAVETQKGLRPQGLGLVLLAETAAQKGFLQNAVMASLAAEYQS